MGEGEGEAAGGWPAYPPTYWGGGGDQGRGLPGGRGFGLIGVGQANLWVGPGRGKDCGRWVGWLPCPQSERERPIRGGAD